MQGTAHCTACTRQGRKTTGCPPAQAQQISLPSRPSTDRITLHHLNRSLTLQPPAVPPKTCRPRLPPARAKGEIADIQGAGGHKKYTYEQTHAISVEQASREHTCVYTNRQDSQHSCATRARAAKRTEQQRRHSSGAKRAAGPDSNPLTTRMERRRPEHAARRDHSGRKGAPSCAGFTARGLAWQPVCAG